MQHIELRSLSFEYPGGTAVFADWDEDIPLGVSTALVGANGTGKTTLLRLLGGILESSNESLMLARRQHRIVYVDHNILSLRHLRVAEYFETIRGLTSLEIGLDLLTDKILNSYVGALSTGQQARVVLSVALATPCDLLLLDEPFNGLDVEGRKLALRALLGGLRSTLIATHDVEILPEFDNVLRIESKVMA